MKMKDFYFELPPELIAQYPTENRGESRLLVFDRATKAITHAKVTDILNFLPDNTLMIFNNTKVRKARIYAQSETGAKVEFLFIKEKEDFLQWTVITNKSKKQKIGKKYLFPDGIQGELCEDLGNGYKLLRLDSQIDEAYLEKHGHIPLPPYIKREDTQMDSSRYQTVYSQTSGSVAAPTAGLHFTEEILDKLRSEGASRGIEIDFVTLHVGLGTFAPVHAENLVDHQMHTEEYEISEATAQRVNSALASNRNILAVGTTSVRTLESAFSDGKVCAGKSSTDLFIYPGYKFNVVSKMFTNFHTPDSTLIVLVSAFAGSENIKNAYNQAIENSYRFFSYGDAMLIL
ncbi:MAG: tRNA preQ1(34) S-adenosylmethionine ribosyltransferase-isomerase QueA [Spirochaetales bacterium]|nr:tRNA preQ1(34) S-adenosylmethionine ribosyltransferase-isomerase QueA [Spirochaetales bacterium]